MNDEEQNTDLLCHSDNDVQNNQEDSVGIAASSLALLGGIALPSPPPRRRYRRSRSTFTLSLEDETDEVVLLPTKKRKTHRNDRKIISSLEEFNNVRLKTKAFVDQATECHEYVNAAYNYASNLQDALSRTRTQLREEMKFRNFDEKDIALLKKKVEGLKLDHNEAIAAIRKQRDEDLRKLRQEHKTANDAHDAQLAKDKQTTEELKESLRKKNDELTRKEAEIQKKQQVLMKKETDFQKMKRGVLRKKNEELTMTKKALNTAEGEREQLRSTIAILDKALTANRKETQASLDKAEKALLAAEAHLARQAEEITLLGKTIETLIQKSNEVMDKTNEGVLKERKELESTKAALATAEGALCFEKLHTARLEETLTNLNTSHAEAIALEQKEHDATKTRNNELMDENLTIKGEHTDLIANLHKEKQEHDATKIEHNNLTLQIELLQQAHQETTNKLASTAESLEAAQDGLNKLSSDLQIANQNKLFIQHKYHDLYSRAEAIQQHTGQIQVLLKDQLPQAIVLN